MWQKIRGHSFHEIVHSLIYTVDICSLALEQWLATWKLFIRFWSNFDSSRCSYRRTVNNCLPWIWWACLWRSCVNRSRENTKSFLGFFLSPFFERSGYAFESLFVRAYMTLTIKEDNTFYIAPTVTNNW